MSVLSYILSVMSPDTCRYYMCKVPPCNHSTQYYIRRTSLLHSFVRYKYETSVTHSSDINSTDTILPCHSNHSTQAAQDLLPKAGKTIKIHKQVLFKKNISRSNLELNSSQDVKRQPVRPCGFMYSWVTCCEESARLPSCRWVSPTWTISPEKRTRPSIWVSDFLDDLCSGMTFYILHFIHHLLFFLSSACIHTVGILGPMFGYLLGSFLAKIYVDVGFVDLGMWRSRMWRCDFFCLSEIFYNISTSGPGVTDSPGTDYTRSARRVNDKV